MDKKYYEYFPSDGEYSAKEYIDEMLSPKIEEKLNMVYIGNYKWCGQWENGVRRAMQLFLLKGDSAIFEWGYNYDFLPLVESGKIKYHRTDKSLQIPLRDMPRPFIDCEEWKDFCIPGHSKYEDKLIERIEEVWNRTYPFIAQWYEKTASLEDMIKETEFQTAYQKYYNFFYPSQQYIKAFLLAKTGNMDLAKTELEASDIYEEASEENQKKLMKKLMDLNEENLS